MLHFKASPGVLVRLQPVSRPAALVHINALHFDLSQIFIDALCINEAGISDALMSFSLLAASSRPRLITVVPEGSGASSCVGLSLYDGVYLKWFNVYGRRGQ